MRIGKHSADGCSVGCASVLVAVAGFMAAIIVPLTSTSAPAHATIRPADNCKVADVLELQRWGIERQEEIGPDGPLYRIKAYANYKRLCAISSSDGTAFLQFKVEVRKFPRKYVWRTLSHVHFDPAGKVDSELRIDLPLVGCTGTAGKWRMKLSFPKGMTSGGGKIKPEIDYLPVNANTAQGGEFISCKQ